MSSHHVVQTVVYFIPHLRTLFFSGNNLRQLDTRLFCNKDETLHALAKNSNLFSELVQVHARYHWDYGHNQFTAHRPSRVLRTQWSEDNKSASGSTTVKHGLDTMWTHCPGSIFVCFPLCNHGFNVYIFRGRGFVGSTALTSNHILCLCAEDLSSSVFSSLTSPWGANECHHPEP